MPPVRRLTRSAVSLIAGVAILAASACGESIAPWPSALIGTEWRVVRLDEAATVVGAPTTRPHLTFGRPGARSGFSAWLGCNAASGRYEADGDAIAFADMMSTLMACQADNGALEGALFGVFARARHWRLENGLLVLRDGARTEIAAFAPYPQDPPAIP